MAATAELKAQANDAFRAGKYAVADQLYTDALKSIPVENPESQSNGATAETTQPSETEIAEAILLGNRANARVKLEMYAGAIEDATLALSKNPTYLKAYYRRGSALFALGKYREAKRDFVLLSRRLPRDADAKRNLAECDKRIRESAFARAIESGEDARVCVSESIDVSSITVNEDYSGPRLPDDGTVTQEFVTELMEHFKNQKRLHLKYAIMIVLAAKQIMDDLPNIVDIPVNAGEKITVCGDVHGQYYDLANAIFEKNGLPSSTNPYLFNGTFNLSLMMMIMVVTNTNICGNR